MIFPDSTWIYIYIYIYIHMYIKPCNKIPNLIDREHLRLKYQESTKEHKERIFYKWDFWAVNGWEILVLRSCGCSCNCLFFFFLVLVKTKWGSSLMFLKLLLSWILPLWICTQPHISNMNLICNFFFLYKIEIRL